MHFKLAYLKLTAFYVLIIMAISIAFSFAIFSISSAEIGRGLGRQENMINKIRPQSDPFFKDLVNLRQELQDESLARIRLNLIYFNLLILFFSAIGSYYFAMLTLRPIEESVEAQARFTGDASHELRTPLAAMKSEIEVTLRDENISLEETKKLLESNLEEIEKLEYLSNSLLKLAKYDEKYENNFRKLLLSDLVVESFERIEPLAKMKSIRFDNHFDDVYVNGDREALIQLIVILMDNAIKYSPKRSKIELTISGDDRRAVFIIRDHGSGIKPSDLQHIFGRFYRADQSRNKEKADGYGLGLSIAKKIVELHSGTISVTSEAGQGSEFVVKLPYAVSK